MRIEVPARRRAGIRLAPLIDVVFILLVFFMLASSFLDWRRFDIGLPPVDARPDPETDPIVLTVTADGSLRLAGEPVPRDTLGARIRALRERDAARPVLVRPDGAAPVQATVAALDRLERAGVGAVSIAGATP